MLLASALTLTNHKALVFKSAKWALCTCGVATICMKKGRNLNYLSIVTFFLKGFL